MLLALATLVLLPGLLVVRAPWTSVPALSLAFWALSAWWPPLAAASRGRVSAGALLVFVPLLLLRLLPKHEVPPPEGHEPRPAPPSGPRPGLPPPRLASAASSAIALAALAVALPGLRWAHPPGPDGAFQAAAARAVLWRDAVPANLEPLLPLGPFGAHAPATATLAADLARASGRDPAAAAAALVAAAAGLALLGLFALHATWAPPRLAALAALVGLAVVPWPQWLAAWGPVDAVLALAFVLPAVALALGHRSRSSAVAASFLLAASALAQPALALAAAAAVIGVASRAALPAALDGAGPRPRRLGLVALLALAFAAPGLRPLAEALTWHESAGAVRAVAAADAAWFASGLLVILCAPLAVAPLLRADRRLAGAVALAAAALLALRVHGWIGGGQLAAADLAALGRASALGSPLDPVCAPEPLRDFVPALAGRPAGEPGPWVPAVFREEWEARVRRACTPLER